jgi:hypothetical protein
MMKNTNKNEKKNWNKIAEKFEQNPARLFGLKQHPLHGIKSWQKHFLFLSIKYSRETNFSLKIWIPIWHLWMY